MKFIRSSLHFNRVIVSLVFSRTFLQLTIFGNSVILGFSYIFFMLERDLNSNISHYFDAIWWGFATATTVGYGDIIPVTFAGKLLGILLMLTGTALFATYTALFAQNILEDEIFRLKFIKKRNTSNLDELLTLRASLDLRIKEFEGNL